MPWFCPCLVFVTSWFFFIDYGKEAFVSWKYASLYGNFYAVAPSKNIFVFLSSFFFHPSIWCYSSCNTLFLFPSMYLAHVVLSIHISFPFSCFLTFLHTNVYLFLTMKLFRHPCIHRVPHFPHKRVLTHLSKGYSYIHTRNKIHIFLSHTSLHIHISFSLTYSYTNKFILKCSPIP